MVTRKATEWASTRRGGLRSRSPYSARLLMAAGRAATAMTGDLEVSGALPESLHGRQLLLAANHIGIFDTAVLFAACHRIGVVPRFVTNGGLFDIPLWGALLRRAGHLRVDPNPAANGGRGTVLLPEVGSGRPVLIYPEGRISRDPDLWPDRGQTSLARIALATGLPVVPLSQWGAHEVIPTATPAARNIPGLVRLTMAWLHALRPGHRITFRVHIGDPVDLAELRADRTGDAMRAHTRIMTAITSGLVPLRADEPGPPRHNDPTRPVGRASPWRPAGPAGSD
jgi:1-acyl-sn-glycerol-3-phosphate acyltransferase